MRPRLRHNNHYTIPPLASTQKEAFDYDTQTERWFTLREGDTLFYSLCFVDGVLSVAMEHQNRRLFFDIEEKSAW